MSSPIRIDALDFLAEPDCQKERANWVAARVGLPTIGSACINEHGIAWTVQTHAAAPTFDSLCRWRERDIQPETDLYPVVVPTNLSPRLTEFIRAVDRCTTKTFAILDTLPGRRNDGHVPGGNHIDTVAHPSTNLLFLDVARVNETVIAHEFGHAWVQYVDESEDLRTLEDASDPRRMRQVNFVQSFVLDLKVNELLARKGFDMGPIRSDQARSLHQLARAVNSGYRPEHSREVVFMALVVADELIRRDRGSVNGIVRLENALKNIQDYLPEMTSLAERLRQIVGGHGYDSPSNVIACIDECLLLTFEHTGDGIDLDTDLVFVNPDEPNIDKFPAWLPMLPPKLKCSVGKHMARSEVSSDWEYSVGPTLAERARITFRSPDGGAQSEIIVPHRIGPPTPYGGMSESAAEILELMRQGAENRRLHNPGLPQSHADLMATQAISENCRRIGFPDPTRTQPKRSYFPGRSYMAGLASFMTLVRADQFAAGEPPYSYAFGNPTTYVDPSGGKPRRMVAGMRGNPDAEEAFGMLSGPIRGIKCSRRDKAICKAACPKGVWYCFRTNKQPHQSPPFCLCLPKIPSWCWPAACLTCNLLCPWDPDTCNQVCRVFCQ